MCRITDYQYTCKHHIQHTWSTCRGQIKADKDSNSNAPACQKLPSLYTKLATKCGSCCRAEAEQTLRRTLIKPNDQSPEAFELILQGRLSETNKQIPTTNWRLLPSPVYSRKPSQKRTHTLRKNSLLRNEFKPEEVGGPEAWEDNVVLPVYEAVEDGWNYPWTAETKSLADELKEDEERRKKEMKDDGREEDLGGDDDDDEAEEDVEDVEEDSGGDDGSGAEDEAEREENDIIPPSEPPETIEADVKESSASVYYRFRKTTRGCKAQVRQWELVEVWA